LARGRGNRSRLLLVILLVTSLFFITLDLRGSSTATSSRSLTQTILAPIQKVVTDIFAPVGRFFSDIKNFPSEKSKVIALESENSKLKSQAMINQDIAGQLKQLKGVLDLAGRGGYQTVSARVIGRGSSSNFSQTVTLDVGTADHVSLDRTVISEHGLVGVIKSVEAHSSIVLLMSDPSFKVGVRIARNQSIGVLSGTGGNTFSLQLLDPAGDIQVGDILFSNGSDSNRPFVPGVPVGQVSSVDHSSSTLTQTATVKSYSDLGNVGVVSVVISAPTTAPKQIINPTPIPTVTVLVTPSPTPSPSSSGGSVTPSPIAVASVSPTKAAKP
jgi:rod shape-determining protein MreC